MYKFSFTLKFEVRDVFDLMFVLAFLVLAYVRTSVPTVQWAIGQTTCLGGLIWFVARFAYRRGSQK